MACSHEFTSPLAEAQEACADELSLNDAATRLGVSGVRLLKLLDNGKIPHRIVNNRKLIRERDVEAYQAEQERLAGLTELTEQAQELGMGY